MAEKKQAMRVAKVSQIKEKHTKERQLAILLKAVNTVYPLCDDDWADEEALWAYKDARALTKALIPGYQNAKNAGDLINRAVLAQARQIRKRAK